MPKSTPTPKTGQSQTLTLPQIEKLLTEQTSVILQAVDEKLSAQDKRMEEKFIAQEISAGRCAQVSAKIRPDAVLRFAQDEYRCDRTATIL